MSANLIEWLYSSKNVSSFDTQPYATEKKIQLFSHVTLLYQPEAE